MISQKPFYTIVTHFKKGSQDANRPTEVLLRQTSFNKH